VTVVQQTVGHPAYLAAVIDIKGSISFDGVRVWSKDRLWLEQLRKQFPQFNGPFPVSRKRQTMWVIACTKREQVAELLRLCYPFLFKKQHQAKSWLNVEVSLEWLPQKMSDGS
jgi:hypothetical protein